jgi:uroporphyrin-III C-methyltransferase
MSSSPPPIGRVYLVGAGPGDPELLTLRAARLITHAGLIVHDGLVDPAILAMAPPSARLVSVAKHRARHTMQQAEINALLVAEALAGNDVVRLKGGDPFVFGRGGEEAEACRAQRQQFGIARACADEIDAADRGRG